jgi:release factor glutamine methyltransferase
MTRPDDPPWTVLRLLNWTRDYLAKAGADAPRLQAQMLLAHVLGCQRIQLYTRFDYQPTAEQLAQFRRLVARAGQDEPVAYLVGHKEFYSLDFRITPDVLVPRAETERLVSEAVDRLKQLGRPGTMWDAYTGSGCIAISAAHEVSSLRAMGTDVSEPAVGVARENAQRLGVADRVVFHVADRLNLPAEAADLTPFDVLTANPPYVRPNEGIAPAVKHEPAVALYGGADGLEFLADTIRQAPAHLRAGGLLAMEFGFGMADAVREIIAAQDAYQKPRILLDQQGIERAVAVRRR